jgi:hypothetical protein
MGISSNTSWGNHGANPETIALGHLTCILARQSVAGARRETGELKSPTRCEMLTHQRVRFARTNDMHD